MLLVLVISASSFVKEFESFNIHKAAGSQLQTNLKKPFSHYNQSKLFRKRRFFLSNFSDFSVIFKKKLSFKECFWKLCSWTTYDDLMKPKSQRHY
jgi:hypothetical protein